MSLFRKTPRFDWEDNRPFTGASDPGQPDAVTDRFSALVSTRVAETVTAQDTAPLDRIRARGPEPATFPALPDTPQDVRDTGPMQRMPRLARVRQRPRPERPYDAALFLWSNLLEQFIMLCGTCPPQRRNRYADPVAGHMPFTFEALRTSAYVSGWRLDAFARWACPACQRTPHYRAPYQVILWDPDAMEARTGDRERQFRDAAELDLILDVAGAANHGRHAVTS